MNNNEINKTRCIFAKIKLVCDTIDDNTNKINLIFGKSRGLSLKKIGQIKDIYRETLNSINYLDAMLNDATEVMRNDESIKESITRLKKWREDLDLIMTELYSIDFIKIEKK